MPRRSVRLQLSGYYNPDGTPTVCYRETRVRKWTYRRYVHTARDKSAENQISCRKSRNGNLFTHTLKHFFVSAIVLAIFYGFTTMIKPPTINTPPTIITTPTLDLPVSSPPTINSVSDPGCKDEGTEIESVKDVMGVLQNKMDYLLPSADLMPNFALKSQGAKVLNWLPSTVHPGQIQVVNWFGFVVHRPSVTPDIVIQGRTRLTPGECWAFEGSQGHLAIALSHRAIVSHVTLGHLPKMVSLTGNNWSAPKEFSVYGKREYGQEWTPLGSFLYDNNRNPLQTFELPSHTRAAYSYIKLHISSNWGHDGYTCLYDFRVHGRIAEGLK